MYKLIYPKYVFKRMEVDSLEREGKEKEREGVLGQSTQEHQHLGKKGTRKRKNELQKIRKKTTSESLVLEKQMEEIVA